jgi:hypothetical protein
VYIVLQFLDLVFLRFVVRVLPTHGHDSIHLGIALL